jgi:DcrB
MLPYYCNEAMLLLPNVRSLVDCTRHSLEIVTEDGAKLDLAIARLQQDPNETLHDVVARGLAEQERRLAGFQVISNAEREYGGLFGIEVRMRFIDKTRGPLYHHIFHTMIETSRVGFFGISTIEHAAACEAWMVSMLSNLKLRS